jgi:UPF0716 protein FxsA
MLPLLLLLFIAVPLLELYVILQVGEAIGVLPTIAILLADSILGGVLMRNQGRVAWRRFTAAMSEGRIPAREAIDGALVIFGGALLLTPGFVTDVFGLLFLLPFTRPLVRRLLVRRFAGRGIGPGGAGGLGGRRGGPRGPGRWDVDGSATEIDPRPRLR